jgi:ATP-dependent Clp protease ATP-binding subunit ClpA
VEDTYQDALKRETRDLVDAARRGKLPPVLFREQEVEQALTHLDAGRSVLVHGPPGVGKTAVIYGLARAMTDRKDGNLRELSTSTVMVGTRFLGEWQTKLMRMATAASAAGAVLYFTDIWNLPTAGVAHNDPANFLDALRPMLESRKLVLVGEVTSELLRKIQRVQSFVTLFHVLSIGPLSGHQVDAIVAGAAKRERVELEEGSVRSLIKLTSRFLPSRHQPGPALNLLHQVRDYHGQKRAAGEPEPITHDFVEKVFSIYTGLPRFVVSRETTMPTRTIREWFQQRIVGQREAIEAVVESVALFKSGLHDPERPLASMDLLKKYYRRTRQPGSSDRGCVGPSGRRRRKGACRHPLSGPRR